MHFEFVFCSFPSIHMFRDVGWSAISIGGSTIHRATGIGIPRRTQDFGKMWKKPNRDKWRSARVWIIDEISMMSAEFLDYLEQTIRQIRTDRRPFGGLQVWAFFLSGARISHSKEKKFSADCSYACISLVIHQSVFLQVIFAGDFFQLQPVQERQTYSDKDQFLNRGLAFESPAWHRANLQMVILKNVFRQVGSKPNHH